MVAKRSELKLKYKKIEGRSDAGATLPHGRVGLTLLLFYSFAKSADEGGRTVRRILVPTFPPHKKKHERSEYIDLNWPLGQSGEGAVFVRFVLSGPSRLVHFSLHNLDYLEKQGGSCGGFEIIQRKLCKSKMIRRGEVSRAKVDKGGPGEVT